MEDWRRIDIDLFDPESSRLTADDLKPLYSTQLSLEDVASRIHKLRSMISSGDYTNAVKLSVTNPPYNADNSAKSQYFQAVLDILSQVKQADILAIVKQLDKNEQTVLIKYLYKGMSVPEGQKQGGILLSWFEKVTQVSGVNPIVRYLSDRETI